MKKQIMIVLMLVSLFAMSASAYAASLEILTTDPAPIVAGDYADVTIRLTQPFLSEGSADVLHDVTLQIQDNTYVQAVDTTPIMLGTVVDGDIYTRTLRVYIADNTPQGTIQLPVMMMVGSAKFTFELDLYVQDASSLPELVIGQIQTVPDKLLVDSTDNVLTFTIQNLGEKDAELVRAKLTVLDEEVSPSFAFSNEDSVASINSGEEVEFEFTLDVDFPTKKLLDAQIVLNYRAKDASASTYGTYLHKIDFDLPLSDSPFLEIGSIEQLTGFTQGSAENKLRVTVQNTGEDEAKEVRIRAVPDISYPFVFETTTQYVASNILPGENASIEFTMEVLSSAVERDYPITLKLESLAGNTRFEQDDVMTVTTVAKKQVSKGSLAFGVVLIVLVVSIIIGINTIRGRRKK